MSRADRVAYAQRLDETQRVDLVVREHRAARWPGEQAGHTDRRRAYAACAASFARDALATFRTVSNCGLAPGASALQRHFLSRAASLVT